MSVAGLGGVSWRKLFRLLGRSGPRCGSGAVLFMFIVFSLCCMSTYRCESLCWGRRLRLCPARRQLDLQWHLVPNRVAPVMAHPVVGRVGQLEVEVPQHLRRDQSHLGVGQTIYFVISHAWFCGYAQRRSKENGGRGNGSDSLLPYAVPRPEAKRLARLAFVVGELVVAVRQPSLREKLFWLGPVVCRM